MNRDELKHLFTTRFDEYSALSTDALIAWLNMPLSYEPSWADDAALSQEVFDEFCTFLGAPV